MPKKNDKKCTNNMLQGQNFIKTYSLVDVTNNRFTSTSQECLLSLPTYCPCPTPCCIFHLISLRQS